ncbi:MULTISPECIES: hypothetical protein [unclassified Bradyrhizobium]|uniref:hypothetical protein n=1 Tax=unclassified Bradyrhizobium TaxID=2631580 RepID=UPI0029163CF1|nr:MULTISPECIES: hypothetical protein [unclassified Bradyrhizobium]
MADSPDWTDETLRPLPELARLAFPDGGVTGETLRRLAREGKLTVYRPGKSYLASLAGVRAMLEQTRVSPEQRAPRTTPAVPNSLGLTAMELSNMALDQALENARSKRVEKRRLRDEERARTTDAYREEIRERRRVRARKRYREKKAEQSR